MESWQQQLTPRSGQGSLGWGWRLSRGAWRLLRRERSAALLALAVGALAALVAVGAVLFIYEQRNGLRSGDLWVIGLAEQSIYLLVGTFLFAALALVVDTAVDGEPFDAADALRETWERRGPLLAWALLSVGLILVYQVIVAAGAPWYLLGVAHLIWSLGTVFVIPILVLDADTVGEAIAESFRTFGRRWRQALAGMVRIGLWTFLALLPLSIAFTLAVDAADPGEGVGLTWVLAWYGFWSFIAGLVAAALLAFALLLYRDSAADLPSVEADPPDPMRLRRRIAVGVAIALGLLLALGVLGALTYEEPEARHSAYGQYDADGGFHASDGYFSVNFGASPDWAFEEGMPIYHRDRQVGRVVECERAGATERVVYWIEPRSRHRARELQLVVYHPRPGHHVARLVRTTPRP